MRSRGGRALGSAVDVTFVAIAGAALVLAVPATAPAAVTFGQLDDFQDGTAMGWREGQFSPNPPQNVPSGGPRGAGDRFLRNVSSTEDLPGSRQIMFNEAQWAGDYNAAGVTRVDAALANLGATPLHMRLALRSAGGTTFGSRAAIDLPADGVWRRVTFDLTSAGLAPAGGLESLSDVLSNARTVRLLSAGAGPAWNGDIIDATLGVDDIRALRLPGDANFDGRVDSADFRITRLNLGTAGSWRQGDFNFDGRVSALDLLVLRRHLGESLPPVSPAAFVSVGVLPEPGTAVAVGLASGVALLRRRRQR